ncbi:hypothetical protein FF011L_33590 [Roseimaritima multifibrata]|uniref:Uncharacterized protein n=1 Tax=Roseimaritima multifibrata TaxID=1930274 RepID=A0A517MI94_9BACT|nr:hypothetical protein FF011L_33590 [Roseimaritima multifibrata]
MRFRLPPSNADRCKFYRLGLASRSLTVALPVLPAAAGMVAARYISGATVHIPSTNRSRQFNPFSLVTSRDQPLAAKLVADGK